MERFDPHPCPSRSAEGRHLGPLFIDRQRHRLVMLRQTGEITGHGISEIGERLVTGGALRNAARQRGALGDKNPILVRLQMDTKFHG